MPYTNEDLRHPTVTVYSLSWNTDSQWSNIPEIGGVYTDTVHINVNDLHDVGNYTFDVTFRIGEGRQLGLLFVDVVLTDIDFFKSNVTYCMGQFNNNKGAKLFAQFVLNHFVETETWEVCPSFEPVVYINGDPFALDGVEIVSDFI